MPSFNPALILFVGLELCYYLLIAQTGIVEVFHSDLLVIGYLPIGGVLGSYISSHISLKQKYKIIVLLTLQAVLTLFYPNYNTALLFLLGFSVGGIAPLMIYTLKKAQSIDFILALSLAYTIGTFLFTTIPTDRSLLGIFLSIGALISYIFINKSFGQKVVETNKHYIQYPLFFMVFWVFLDSTLFETLSRDIVIPIWRGEYTFEIITFHIIGVIAGMVLKQDYLQKSLTILVLFAISYLFYFLREPLLLSIVYPFVISFYNVAILQSLVTQKSLKKLGLYMIFIGWIASGGGLFVALSELIIFVPLAFLIVFIYIVNKESNYNLSLKEFHHAS